MWSRERPREARAESVVHEEGIASGTGGAPPTDQAALMALARKMHEENMRQRHPVRRFHRSVHTGSQPRSDAKVLSHNYANATSVLSR